LGAKRQFPLNHHGKLTMGQRRLGVGDKPPNLNDALARLIPRSRYAASPTLNRWCGGGYLLHLSFPLRSILPGEIFFIVHNS
jgi:hypothetical protein